VSLQSASTAPTTPGAAAGTIYDIGYRRYDGPRLGRAHAVAALFTHGVRAAFGIGRSARAKAAPGALLLFASMPALVEVTAANASQGIFQVDYSRFITNFGAFFALFCAAQAPELVCGDQQHRVLPLYFSRAVSRTDYALAKVVGFVGALLLLMMLPESILFFGKALISADLWGALKAEAKFVWPILASVFVSAWLLGASALLIASFAKRRAYATAAVVGVLLLVTNAIAAIVTTLPAGTVGRYAVLVSPLQVLDGFVSWMFDKKQPRFSIVGRANLPGEVYAYVAIGLAVLCTLGLVMRYRKVHA
jgi:ABC-2 type transport system permease protein